jgi:hypothetical protein
MRGSADAPVVGVTVANLTLAHTSTTFLRPYAVGYGGDFSFYPGGAVVAQGTENAVVAGCTFMSIGNNGLAILGYNRDVSVVANEFAYIGDSAILSVGQAQGIDGLAMVVPDGTLVEANLMRELTIWTKQAGAYYGTLSSYATLAGNAMFNFARAGFNLNDDAYGGHLVTQNLGFNTVRSTSDHGVYNSWGREPLNHMSREKGNMTLYPDTIRVSDTGDGGGGRRGGRVQGC